MLKPRYLDVIRVVFLPDIHFGPSKDNVNITQSLVECVYPWIEANQPDLIVIGGDDTDDRISLDQAAARYYIDFWNRITSFKLPNGDPLPVRFVAGTESHQKGQLQAFQSLVSNPNANVKIFETVGEEDFNGVDILYVPEEAVYDKQQYYAKTLFSGKKYDLCFGHGMFDFIGNNGWGLTSERSLKGSPIWNIRDFECVLGGVFFGHIHIHQDYKDRIFYGGSLTRFCQGEPQPKGFLCVDYDKSSFKHDVEFIENPFAPNYVTITLQNPDRPLEAIVEDLKRNRCKELRVMVNRHAIDKSKLQILKKYFSDNKEYGVRIEVMQDRMAPLTPIPNIVGIDSNGMPVALPPEIPNIQNQFPGITDPIDWENNTITYAKQKYDVDVNREDMLDIIGKCTQME